MSDSKNVRSFDAIENFPHLLSVLQRSSCSMLDRSSLCKSLGFSSFSKMHNISPLLSYGFSDREFEALVVKRRAAERIESYNGGRNT